MKTTVLQLETYDSRQSILDKFSRANGGRILLVWPKRGKLDLSEVDLVLVARAAEEGSVALALVSHSPQVIDLAQAHNINCFQSISAAEHSRWKKVPSVQDELKQHPQSQNFKLSSNPMRASLSEKNKKFIFWLSAILSALAIFALLGYLLPSARVILTPKKHEKIVEIAVWGSPKFKSVNVNGNLPLIEKTIELSNSKSVLSSGKVAIPDAFASAMVEFTNLTSQDLVVPLGTIVSTDEDTPQRFSTEAEIILGTGSESSASVPVKALIPGSKANVPAGAIQLVEGNLGGWVKVSNPEAASGGVDSEAPSPSEEDYAAARNSLLEEIKTQAIAKFATDADLQFIVDSITSDKVISETRSVEVGQPGEQGILTLTVDLTALGYFQKDLQMLALQSLQADLQPSEGFYASTATVSQPKNVQSDGQGGYRWTTEAVILVGAKTDPYQIAQLITGQKYDQASVQLQNILQFKKAPEYHPFVSPFRLPWATFRIKVEVQ